MTKIQILGSGCARCRQLTAVTEQAAQDLGLRYELEKVTDVARYAIGVEVLRPDGQGGYKKVNAVVVPTGSVYGQEFKRIFHTAEDGMTDILFVLYKGDSPNLVECEWLMEAVISDLPPDRPRGKPVEVTLGYDYSGILRGSAVDLGTAKDCTFVVDRHKIE